MKRKPFVWVENWEPALIVKLDTPCWECVSHYISKGYPKVGGYYGYVVNVHRYIYEEMFGFLEKGILVRHKCDNPLCINIQHLESGTDYDNAMDRVTRRPQTILRGENASYVKLTEDQARYILTSEADGSYKIGKKYNVSHTTIRSLRKAWTWKHVHEKLQNEGIKIYTVCSSGHTLTNSQINEIRAIKNISQNKIAEIYGITQSGVSRIINRKRREKE